MSLIYAGVWTLSVIFCSLSLVTAQDSCGKDTYGPNCTSVCGHCKNNSTVTCDAVNGTCEGGCQEGWTGDKCNIPGGEVHNVLHVIIGVIVVLTILVLSASIIVGLICWCQRKKQAHALKSDEHHYCEKLNEGPDQRYDELSGETTERTTYENTPDDTGLQMQRHEAAPGTEPGTMKGYMDMGGASRPLLYQNDDKMKKSVKLYENEDVIESLRKKPGSVKSQMSEDDDERYEPVEYLGQPTDKT